jgi:WD40 repeat protein
MASVLVWHGPDPSPSLELPGHKIIVFSVAFDPTGRFLASAGDDLGRPGTTGALVWDLAEGKEAFALDVAPSEGRIFALDYSPDGRWIAGGGVDRRLKLWSASTGRRAGVIGRHENEIVGALFSANGRRLASVGNDNVVKVWDATRLESPQSALHAFPSFTIGFKDSAALDALGERLAVVASDETIAVHDLAGASPSKALFHPGHQPQAVAFTPDGRWLASGGADSAVRIWDPQTGEARLALRSHRGRIVRLRFGPHASGVRLISGSVDGTVKLWDMAEVERRLASP